MSERPRAVFFGTPAFAVPCLEALHEIAEVSLVVCQPDRPRGRGMKLAMPPVKERALALGLEVTQPTKIRRGGFADTLREHRPEVAVVVAYGRILPAKILAIPDHGCVNVHASLLPRWRGAAPIQWSITAGDKETGVTLMQMDEGMDTGPMLATRSTPIGADERAGELGLRLSALGAELLREELLPFLAGERPPRAQDSSLATMAPLLSKEEAFLDLSQTAQQVHDRARGMHPWPGAVLRLGDKRLKLHRTQVAATEGREGAPGEVLLADQGRIEVACGEGKLVLLELQLEGKRRMEAAQFLAGRALSAGDRIESLPRPKREE